MLLTTSDTIREKIHLMYQVISTWPMLHTRTTYTYAYFFITYQLTLLIFSCYIILNIFIKKTTKIFKNITK